MSLCHSVSKKTLCLYSSLCYSVSKKTLCHYMSLCHSVSKKNYVFTRPYVILSPKYPD